MGAPATPTGLTLRIVEDFGAVEPARWEQLLAAAPDLVFLERDWQREWWQAFSGERLLVVLAERGGELAAIAPLFTAGEMLFLVGSGGSDYLDVIGRPDEQTLAAMLDAARSRVRKFAGIGLYHLPAESRTSALLPGVAARLALDLQREETIGAPYIDLGDSEAVTAFLERRKLRKEEARMRRAAPLRICSARSEDLEGWTELLLAQHAARWRPLGVEGFDADEASAFCRAIIRTGHRAGWLRFTMLEWDGAPAAFDVTLVRGERHLSYLVSRDTSIRSYSPAKVLEAHVVRAALQEGARCFDLGLGEEDYKLRSASGVRQVTNWFMYP